jgi:hypothetical protein
VDNFLGTALGPIIATMNFLTELEDQFSELSQPKAPYSARVVTKKIDVAIEKAYLGKDFICGMSSLGLIAVPTSKILRILSPNLPIRTEITLLELLAVQKQPVLIQCPKSDQENCWLLNVSDDWLRVATKQGIAWLAQQSIELVKFSPVDN